jgi:U3 small nucleolar RNA-associated protein 15
MAATSFKKTLAIENCRKLGDQTTPDVLYWRGLEFPIIVKQNAAVSHIEFSPVSPHDYVITSSTKAQIFCHRTNQPIKSLTRFRETAYSCSYRSDGQLLVAGGEEPVVRVFSGKKVLRELKGHTRPIHVTRFTRDNHRLFSGSDDLSVKLWDLPSESTVVSYSEHQDYVRCGAASKASCDVILTGSYDHTLRMFDTRCPSTVLTINHGQPVEAVLFFPSGGLFVSAGGNVVKVWDAVAGGRLLTQFSNHHKTITSLCFASDYRRLVSCSLDRHVKFYDVSTYQVVHTLDFPSAILSVAVSPTDDLLTVGMADGLLSIQRRRDEAETAAAEREKRKRKRKLVGSSWSQPMHCYALKPDKEDQVVERQRKSRLEKYDVCLRKFQYSKALDCAMDIRVRTKTPDVTMGVILELIRRSGLRSALAGRDDESVASILTFMLKNISETQYVNTLLDMLTMLIDLYHDQADAMPSTRQVMSRLNRAVEYSVDATLDKCGSVGLCDLILASSVASGEEPSLNGPIATLDSDVMATV